MSLLLKLVGGLAVILISFWITLQLAERFDSSSRTAKNPDPAVPPAEAAPKTAQSRELLQKTNFTDGRDGWVGDGKFDTAAGTVTVTVAAPVAQPIAVNGGRQYLY